MLTDTTRRRDPALIALLAIILHSGLLIADVAMHYAGFLRGDRAGMRWQSLLYFDQHAAATPLATLLQISVVPGEYLLAYPFYLALSQLGILIVQVALLVASATCVAIIAQRMFSQRNAGLIVGIVYLLLPNNLVFPHQFVTEAFATPFMCFFLYAVCVQADRFRGSTSVLGGVFLGLAIFARPSLALVSLGLMAMCFVYRRYVSAAQSRAALVIACLSLVPLSLWTATYTVSTGKFGYSSGVANLAWNLRSKIWLLSTRNGIPLEPHVAGFKEYADLYADRSGGIGTGEFLTFAVAHPKEVLRGSAEDLFITLGRGNASKLFVDYLALADESQLKGWRDAVARKGMGGVFELAQNNPLTMLFIVVEIASTLIVLLASLVAVVYGLWTSGTGIRHARAIHRAIQLPPRQHRGPARDHRVRADRRSGAGAHPEPWRSLDPLPLNVRDPAFSVASSDV